MKLLKFLSVLSLVVVVFSCSEDANSLESETNSKESISYLSIFEEAGWEKTYDLGDQVADEKANYRVNYCQLGNGAPFECSGTCVGLRNYGGHDFCVGCEIDDVISGTLACTGSSVVVVFNDLLVAEPLVSIDFKIFDDTDTVVASGSGSLASKVKEITDAMDKDGNPKIEFELY